VVFESVDSVGRYRPVLISQGRISQRRRGKAVSPETGALENMARHSHLRFRPNTRHSLLNGIGFEHITVFFCLQLSQSCEHLTSWGNKLAGIL
jgi:hypothetical protein